LGEGGCKIAHMYPTTFVFSHLATGKLFGKAFRYGVYEMVQCVVFFAVFCTSQVIEVRVCNDL